MTSSSSQSSQTIGVYLALICTLVYGYTIYYLNSEENLKGWNSLFPEEMRVFGHYKFLTHQSLIMQFLYCFFHVAAHLVKPLEGTRNLLFAAFAWPIGILVQFTFWFVWFAFGRHLIFPIQLEAYYPNWTNQVTHTMVVPVNIIFLLLKDHKFNRKQIKFSIAFCLCYMVVLHYVWFKSGRFLYMYIDVNGPLGRLAIFAASGTMVILNHVLGSLISSIVHKPHDIRESTMKGKTQQQID